MAQTFNEPSTVERAEPFPSLPALSINIEPCLRSELTIVDLYLADPQGKVARYRKQSGYVITCAGVHSFKEGVAAVGYANHFECSPGFITRTEREHGFYLSTIDLGNVFQKGARFTSTYSAVLNNSFMMTYENWTQEVATPTEYLLLRIHFPRDRGPTLVKCKLVDGLLARQVATAELIEENGMKSVVWKIPKPTFKAVYKVEWVW